jgi:DNA-directed RNA polymerase sigma subunit (sigma70/sigma32)
MFAWDTFDYDCPYYDARREYVLWLYSQNVTYREIGERLGVTLQRARDIAMQANRRMRQPRETGFC